MSKHIILTRLFLLALSIAVYWSVWNWRFALLIIVTIGYHEQSHINAMNWLGIKNKGWFAIPLLGGCAISIEEYKTEAENAFVSIMGPVGGLLMSAVGVGIYYLTHNPFWAAATFFVALINLFNLLPVNPLDGGQLVRSMTFSFGRKIGLAFLIVSMTIGTLIVIKTKIWLLALVLVFGGMGLYIELRYSFDWWMYERSCKKAGVEPAKIEDYGKEPMNKWQLLMTSVAYLSTGGLLFLILKLMVDVKGLIPAVQYLFK